ncbi:hypothetical protein E7T09_04520 [Deinococcus sp. KSM4-11]|uniref:hypothetical protein n=1 Tax=Deinococcus sp. KSM4-11 TaxID=2568654 RepID=UPI0010A47456|nr:hypothetical protein [Deinococcus sp. KSM4-11]THF88475.1 hypothetical protein E7T09_04520 [Deinococcus sp. KSM4-11]
MAPQVKGEAFTGLDPLTRSLVEAAPLVPVAPAPPLHPSPPTQALPAVARRTLKQPAILVALGGSLAAGLLVFTGAASRRGRTGHPSAGRGSAAAPTPTTPILPVSVPAPAATWLMAGGH